jgi:hypothetical protein
MQSVHLTPPPASTNVPTLPDVSQVSGAPETPVSLTPPSEGAASAQPRYLPDSRYAARRGSADDSSTGN